MKIYLNILFAVLLCSCSTLNYINQSQLLADDINCTIDDFNATYYRYPNNVDEFYKFIVLNYDLDNRTVYKDKYKVVKYVKTQKDNIYIYSNNHFMFFYGRKSGITIDKSIGLCDWLKFDNHSITTKLNASNFFAKDGDIIHKSNEEFENNLKIIRSKYTTPSFITINGDSILNRGVFQYDRKNNLVPLCELSNLSECKSFMTDLKSYLKEFTSEHEDIERILFYTTIKKDNTP